MLAACHEQLERFTEPEAFRLWLVTFEHANKAEQQTDREGPIIVPYGWHTRTNERQPLS